MGYRTIIHNELGHVSHHFVLHDSRRQNQTDARIILSCWCGEIIHEVRS